MCCFFRHYASLVYYRHLFSFLFLYIVCKCYSKKKKIVVTVIWINLLVVLLYNLYKNFKITVALSTSSEDFNTKIGISIQTLNVTIYYNDFQCYRDIHAYHTEQIKNSF